MTSRLLILLACLSPALSAMEIPLERRSGRESKGVVIGFVDMARIYQEFPETRKARQEYQSQADKMKQLLTDKEAEVSDLREQLAVLKASAEQPAASTGAATIPTGDLAEKERLLTEQETSLSQARREAAEALTAFEKRRASQIFGKLYQSLVQIADEKGVDVVLDKSALLYGQKGVDLTESLSRRVRGLPDEEPAP